MGMEDTEQGKSQAKQPTHHWKEHQVHNQFRSGGNTEKDGGGYLNKIPPNMYPRQA